MRLVAYGISFSSADLSLALSLGGRRPADRRRAVRIRGAPRSAVSELHSRGVDGNRPPLVSSSGEVRVRLQISRKASRPRPRARRVRSTRRARKSPRRGPLPSSISTTEKSIGSSAPGSSDSSSSVPTPEAPKDQRRAITLSEALLWGSGPFPAPGDQAEREALRQKRRDGSKKMEREVRSTLELRQKVVQQSRQHEAQRQCEEWPEGAPSPRLGHAATNQHREAGKRAQHDGRAQADDDGQHPCPSSGPRHDVHDQPHRTDDVARGLERRRRGVQPASCHRQGGDRHIGDPGQSSEPNGQSDPHRTTTGPFALSRKIELPGQRRRRTHCPCSSIGCFKSSGEPGRTLPIPGAREIGPASESRIVKRNSNHNALDRGGPGAHPAPSPALASSSLTALRRGWAQLIRGEFEIDSLVRPRRHVVTRVAAFITFITFITEGRVTRNTRTDLGELRPEFSWLAWEASRRQITDSLCLP